MKKNQLSIEQSRKTENENTHESNTAALQRLKAENKELQREILKLKNTSKFDFGYRSKNIELFKENRRLGDETKHYRTNCENQNEKIKKLNEELTKTKKDNFKLYKIIRSMEYKTKCNNNEINVEKKDVKKPITKGVKKSGKESEMQNVYMTLNKEKRLTAKLTKMKDKTDNEVLKLKQKIVELEGNEGKLSIKAQSQEIGEVTSPSVLRHENERLKKIIETLHEDHKVMLAAETEKHEKFKKNCTKIFEHLNLKTDAIQKLTGKLEKFKLKDNKGMTVEEQYKDFVMKHKEKLRTKNKKPIEEAVNSKALTYLMIRNDINSLIENRNQNLRILKLEENQDNQKTLKSSVTPIIGKHFKQEFKTNEINGLIFDSVFQGSQHNSVLRRSLFSHVPPYIRFFSHDFEGNSFPLNMQSLLKWYTTNYTPAIVVHIIQNSGFMIMKSEHDVSNNDSNDWIGTWEKHTDIKKHFKDLDSQQKINNFPGTSSHVHKDKLWANIRSLKLKFGKSRFDIMPKSYILPEDAKFLHLNWHECDKWIVKPPLASKGNGIKIVTKLNEVPKSIPLVIQQYISDPFLINGTKFDLRLYLLITSVNPLKLYLYENGLVRFASVKYSSKISTITNKFMHLTNYSINKNNHHFTENQNAHACHGHKWALRSFWTYMEEQLKIDVKQLKDSLVDSVIKTIISGESTLNNSYRSDLNNRYNAYELLGVDVLIDASLKPWILEVQRSPSLKTSSYLDVTVKGPLVRNVLNIVGYHLPKEKASSSNDVMHSMLDINIPLFFNETLYTRRLSGNERKKQEYFSKMKTRAEYIDKILDNLLPDDVRHLILYEDELTQIGSFQKIFPTTSSYEYHQYFEGARYYDMLFDAWECKYNGNRTDGIDVLEKLCQLEVHLEVSNIHNKKL